VKGEKPKLLVILGPTAAGKSVLGIRIASELNAQILSADSLQVYRHFDIGTAKPTPQDQKMIKHHLLDIADPDQEFNAGMFRQSAGSVILDLHSRGVNTIVAGGTYLYVKILLSGLIEGLPSDPDIRADIKKQSSTLGISHVYGKLSLVDPEAAEKIHPNDYVRIERALEVYYLTGQKISALHSDHGFEDSEYEYMKIGITLDRESLRRRIDGRVDSMIGEGLIDEVRRIREMGYGTDIKPMQSIGYKQINSYLDAEIGQDEAIELIKRDTKRFAKRQMTWLRQDSEIKWYEIPRDENEIINLAGEFFSS